jgi:DNA-binding NarL/FixJ family response regulator
MKERDQRHVPELGADKRSAPRILVLAVALSSNATAQGKHRVLAIEDEPTLLRGWRRELARHGIDLVAAKSCAEALSFLYPAHWRTASCAYALVDLHLPDGDGLSLLEPLQRAEPRPEIAVVSGFIDAKIAMRLQSAGVFAVPKPMSAQELVHLLALLDRRRLSIDVSEFAAEFRLSDRELEALVLAVEGFDREQTALSMQCSTGTVKTYWDRIRLKTGEATQERVVCRLVRFRSHGSDKPS